MKKHIPHTTFEKELMQNICRYIETHSDKPLTLGQLAKQAHLSPAYLQRRFKAAIGVSPKEYADSCRLKKLKAGLRHNADASVTDVIYDTGYASSSRVYERLDTSLGMTPKQYRTHGKGLVISYATTLTPLGCALIGATDRGLCFLQFGNGKTELIGQLAAEYSKAILQPMETTHEKQFVAWMQALSDYLHGHCPALNLPLDICGTVFQLRVWKYLQTIPAGNTQSYTEVAEGIGNPKAARAIAKACANNPIAIVIPCHRVIRGNGEMAGYRWGMERKRALLDLEHNACQKSGQ